MASEPANPYIAPSALSDVESGGLPPGIVKKATNITRDARLAVMVGLIPLLGLIFILRLVQWYQLRRDYPMLVSNSAGQHQELSTKFRAARSSLWVPVLLWPVVILSCGLYLRFSH